MDKAEELSLFFMKETKKLKICRREKKSFMLQIIIINKMRRQKAEEMMEV